MASDFENPYDDGMQNVHLDSLYSVPENRLLESRSLPPVTLVLGGVRSGKSHFAERMLPKTARPCYLATGEALDDEMRHRIYVHQNRRGEHWTLREEPLEIATALRELESEREPVLVDSLGMWLNNLLYREKDVEQELIGLLDVLSTVRGPVILVSEEVGLGIVPENRLARDYRDRIGLMNQRVAQVAQQVIFVAAGLPLLLKGIQK
jgi:adenosylcobinamide kinase/adenosylcobinamide-phosphate guanylyltransferase